MNGVAMDPGPSPAFHLRRGFDDGQRRAVAQIYHDAFRRKIAPALGAPDLAVDFLEEVITPQFAFIAERAGEPVAVAGFKTAEGAFTGGGKGGGKLLAKHYGTAGAIWRGAILSLLERPVRPEVLLMDGIAVSSEARGMGIGTALLGMVCAEARDLGLDSVRLDVIDANKRARALYERLGFEATETIGLGVLAWVFGFREVTTMVRRVR